jgi:hypothetical protein
MKYGKVLQAGNRTDIHCGLGRRAKEGRKKKRESGGSPLHGTLLGRLHTAGSEANPISSPLEVGGTSKRQHHNESSVKGLINKANRRLLDIRGENIRLGLRSENKVNN